MRCSSQHTVCEQEAVSVSLLPAAPESCTDLFQKDQSNADPFPMADPVSSGVLRELSPPHVTAGAGLRACPCLSLSPAAPSAQQVN